MKKIISLLISIIMLIPAFPVITYAEDFNTGAHQVFMDFENGVSNISSATTPTAGGVFVDRTTDSSALSDANGDYVYSLPVTNSTNYRSGGYISLESVFGTGNVFNPGDKLIIECDYYNHGNSEVYGFGFSFPQTNDQGNVTVSDMRRPLLWWTKEAEDKRWFVCKGTGYDSTAWLDTAAGWYTIKTEVYFASDAADSSWEIISFKKQGASSYTSLPKIMLDGSHNANNNSLPYSKGEQKHLGIFGTSVTVKNYIDNLKITLLEKELFESIQSASAEDDIKAIIADFSLIDGFEYLAGYSSLHSAYKNHIARRLLENRLSLESNEAVRLAYEDYADDEIDVSGTYTISIKGSSVLLKPMNNTTASVSYKVFDNDNNETDGVTWQCTGAEVLNNGTLLFNKYTPSSVTLKATDSMGVSCEKTISVSDGFFDDFENKSVGTKLDAANSYGEIREDGTKHAHFPAVDTGSGSYDAGVILNNTDGISDTLNLSFGLKAETPGSYRLPAILGKDSSGGSQWLNESQYTVEESGTDYIYTFKIQTFADGTTSSYITKNLTVSQDEWINVSFCIDSADQSFDIRMSGDSSGVSADNVKFKTIDTFNISALRFRANAAYARGDYDNISFNSGDSFPRVLTFAGSDTMTLSSDGGTKLLVATLTDNGTENNTHSVRWELCGVSGDFTGSADNVKILGSNQLVVDGYYSGSVFVRGVLDDNVTSTPIVEIKLNSAFSTVDNSGSILVNGTPGHTYTVNVYRPVSSDFISACLGYDVNNCSTDYVSIQPTGEGNIDVSSMMIPDGMYMVEIINQNNPLDTNVFELYKNTDILKQSDRELLFSQDNISAYLLNFTNASAELIDEAVNQYNSLSSDAKKASLRFSGNDINDAYPSIYLASVLNGNKQLGDKCKNLLNAKGLAGSTIPILTANSEYSRIGNQIIAESLITTAILTDDYLLEYPLSRAIDALLEELVLTGVRQSGSFPTGVSKYLELLGNDYYDNAGADLKADIHTAIAGNDTYTSLSQINTDINNVPEPEPEYEDTGLGGAGGTGGGGSFVNTSATPTAPAPVIPAFAGFSDVYASHWAHDYITHLAKSGIVTGYNGCYYPENSITRAEYAKIIYSAFNIPDTDNSFFADVPRDLWCHKAVNALAGYGIVTGYDGNFHPDTPISRQDAAVIAARAMEKRGYIPSGYSAEFNDLDKISDYAKASVSYLAFLNILTGTPEGNYEPMRNITKAESSAVICRILNVLAGGDNQ